MLEDVCKPEKTVFLHFRRGSGVPEFFGDDGKPAPDDFRRVGGKKNQGLLGSPLVVSPLKVVVAHFCSRSAVIDVATMPLFSNVGKLGLSLMSHVVDVSLTIQMLTADVFFGSRHAKVRRREKKTR